MKFSIKNFFSKCDKICSFLRIWSRLLKKSLKENFIFCAMILLVLEKAVTNSSLFKNLLPCFPLFYPTVSFILAQVLVLGIDKVKYMN